MPASWMSGPVTATSGQPVTGWQRVTPGVGRDLTAFLQCDSGDVAHMIVEGAHVVNSGVAEASEVIYSGADLPCAVGAIISLKLSGNKYAFLRISASSDSSSSVYAGFA